MKRKMKSLFVWVMLVVLVFSLTGCKKETTGKTSGGDTQDTATADNTKKADEPKAEVKTLTLLMYTDWYKSGWVALEKYISDNSERLGFKLDIQKVAGGEQGDQLLKVKFATGELPDLIQTYSTKWIDTGANGLESMVDLTGINTSDYDQNIIDNSYVYKGKLYGMPIDSVNLSGVFYNKEVFAKVGVEVPKTWDEFLAVCEKIKAAGITPVYASFKDSWTAQLFPLTGLTQDIVDSGKGFTEYINNLSTNKIKYSECTNFIDSIEKSKELITKGYVNDTYLSDTYDSAHTALAEGTAAMYINATWSMDEVFGKYPDAKDKIGSFPVPTGDGYTNIFLPFTIGVTTKSKDVELAKKAIEFIASAEAQQIYTDGQPGICLNQNITSAIPEAMQSLKDVIDSGKGMTDFEGEVMYPYGDFGSLLINYYVEGGYKEAVDVTKEMDKETEKNAKAKNDANWN